MSSNLPPNNSPDPTPDAAPVPQSSVLQSPLSSSPSSVSATVQVVPERVRHLQVEFFFGVLILLVFIVLELVFDTSTLAHGLRTQTVAAWHWLNPFGEKDVPVLIVDITRMHAKEYAVTHQSSSEREPDQIGVTRELFTPRAELRQLIEQIRAKNPAAIGVDIDLSIEPELLVEKTLRDESHALFDWALGQTNVRGHNLVFFGVKRNDGRAPDQWLGEEKYIPLAASLARPLGLVTHLPYAFQFPNQEVQLPSLSKAVGAAYLEFNPLPAKWWDGIAGVLARKVLIERPVAGEDGFIQRQFLVDYSPLQKLTEETMPYEKVAGATTNFQDKIVLIGDAQLEEGADRVFVPGKTKEVAGVYVHACAAYTLTQAPLLELKPIVGLLLAVMASFSGLLFIYAICKRFAPQDEVTTIPLTILATFGSVVFFLALACFSGFFLRILWMEVVIVCAFLFLECLLHIFLGEIGGKWAWASRSVQWMGDHIFDPISESWRKIKSGFHRQGGKIIGPLVRK